MPFGLHLKKSRHYNVVSKSLFVISVELLDGTNIECSLSAESLGSDCHSFVCHRLGISQNEFFGLCYMSRHGIPKWIEMNRPLKKQLDRFAKDFSLYLRVMYYISKVSLIHDDNTRSQYFLQVKKDVLDGRINCNVEQAVQLASFSMQAEFGNHDMERHTAEYLKDFAIFPQHIMETGHMGLFEAVVQQHAALAGLPQGVAEGYYIMTAQQLEGYGQETFLCVDHHKNETVIGVCLNGIASSTRFYEWKDITNVINHKKQFGIECQAPEDNVQFEFPDPESAKYLWKLCVLQHKFYMQVEQSNSESRSVIQHAEHVGTGEARMASETPEELETWSVAPRVQSTSCVDLTTHAEIDKLRALLPTYRRPPGYDTAMQNKFIRQSSNNTQPTPTPHMGLLYSSQPEIHQSHLHENVRGYRPHFPDVAQVKAIYLKEEPPRIVKNLDPPAISLHNTYSAPALDAIDGQVLADFQMLHLYKAPPPYRDPTVRPNSNSTPDLASQTLGPLTATYINTQVSGSSPDLVSSRSINHILQQQFHPNPEAHRTYTNLAMMDDIKPVEPIYENVPLPWRDEKKLPVLVKPPPTPITTVTISSTTTTPLASVPANMTVQSQSSTALNDSFTSDATTIDTNTTQGSSDISNTDINGKTKTWKKWAILGKGKSNTLQKPKPRNLNTTAARDQAHRWSTGLPRLPLPPTVSKENMCQLLEWKLTDSHLFYEFEKIPKKKPQADFSCAVHPENLAKNRYKDVLPYEENRVRLTPTKDNKMGYVNASQITATVGNSQRFYIAAQSPMTNTLNAFWQAIWEVDVYLLIRLTSDIEDGGACCYLPNLPSQCLQVGEFQIVKEFSQETGHCLTSRLRVFHVPTKRSRAVWHLQYVEWGEHGCPSNTSHFLGFLEELNSVRQHTIGDVPAGHNKNPPVMVHCSAGVGRTGVTIVCDILLHTMDHNQEVDVPRVVSSLRHQRMLMVQTVAQYRFIYNLLITYLKRSRLI